MEESMDEIKIFEKDISSFNDEVQILGNCVNDSNINWKDKKYEEIKNLIASFASSSRNMIQLLESCDQSLRKFDDYRKED